MLPSVVNIFGLDWTQKLRQLHVDALRKSDKIVFTSRGSVVLVKPISAFMQVYVHDTVKRRRFDKRCWTSVRSARTWQEYGRGGSTSGHGQRSLGRRSDAPADVPWLSPWLMVVRSCHPCHLPAAAAAAAAEAAVTDSQLCNLPTRETRRLKWCFFKMIFIHRNEKLVAKK